MDATAKRSAFKRLLAPRIKNVVTRFKQVKNLANQRNYCYTKEEANQVIQIFQVMLDDITEVFSDNVESYPLEHIRYSHTKEDK